VSVRLGVPCYPYDTLRLTGEVTEVRSEGSADEAHTVHVVKVTGKVPLGDHVVGRVRLVLPEDAGA
jgi:hypothetical protein